MKFIKLLKVWKFKSSKFKSKTKILVMVKQHVQTRNKKYKASNIKNVDSISSLTCSNV